MENKEASKTSDEIINELFSSLNVPLSPKSANIAEKQGKGDPVGVPNGESEINSEDEDSDSKSSDSEGGTKGDVSDLQEDSKTDKAEKSKSHKKKKDKKKKKKKHKRKEDGSRHKHKKRKKRESTSNFEIAEEAKLAADVIEDVKAKNKALIEKISQEDFGKINVSDNKENDKLESANPKLVHEGNSGKKEQSSHEEHLNSNNKITISKTDEALTREGEVVESSRRNDGSATDTTSENASKLLVQCSSTDRRTPENVSGIEATQSVKCSQKRKRSPVSKSPSPTHIKKVRSLSPNSPTKSSSPKPSSEDKVLLSAERPESAKCSTISECSKTSSKSPPAPRSDANPRRSRSRSRRRSTSKSSKNSESRKSQLKSSKSKEGSRERSRSKKRSEERSGTRRSREGSESKNRSKKSSERSVSRRSRGRSDSKSRRSRSRSKRSRSKTRKRSRGDTRSRSRSRGSRSRVRQRSRSASRRSRSKSYRRKSRSRSDRSRSKSTHKSPVKERFDMFAVMRERANRLAELKSQGIPDGSLGSLLVSTVKHTPNIQNVASSIQDVPLPTSVPDPSSIPLPSAGSVSDSLSKKTSIAVPTECAEVSGETTTPITEEVTRLSMQEEEGEDEEEEEEEPDQQKEGVKNKQEEGSGKAKTIITIKSLKDSLVYQQAQEEAERKAREKEDSTASSDDSEFTETYHTELEQSDRNRNEEELCVRDKLDKIEFITEISVADKSEKNYKDERKDREETEKEKHNEKEKHAKEKKRKESISPNVETDINVEDQCSKCEDIKESEPECRKRKHSDKDSKEERKQSKKEEENKESVLLKKVEEEEVDSSSKSSELRKEFKEKNSNKNCDKDGSKADIELSKDATDTAGSKQTQSSKREESVTTIPERDQENPELLILSKGSEEKRDKDPNKVEGDDECEHSKTSKAGKVTESEEAKDSHNCGSVGGKQEHSDEDSADKIEEGEIVSDKEEPGTSLPSKSHSSSKKKSKKDKSSTKERKKSTKDKTRSKEDKKKQHEKKRGRTRSQSRDKDRYRSKHHSSSSAKDHSHSKRHRKRSRSRSRSPSKDHYRRYNRSRSRSRSKSRSKRHHDSTSDLRDKLTRKRLLEIARRNAVYLVQNGCLPPNVEQQEVVQIKAGEKSVDELTDFCKQLVASGNYSDVDVSDPSISSEEENTTEKPFSSTQHPFSVRDNKPILMNIRNAPMLPTKTNAERLAGQAKLREQFPVSSGSQHRTKGELSSSDWKHPTESEWVPVQPKEKKDDDKVFNKPEAPAVDISQIVSTRLSAMRKLQDNPNDSEAIKTLNNVQKEMQNWALSKQEPGQFTGTTGVKILSQEELASGHQAWARKEQFKEAAPVRPQFGLKMLQKMGWSPGEGLGKNKEGTTEPLLLDVKMDKKGFHAQEEVTPKKQPIPLVKDLSGKHPVSALVELCSKRKWSPPDFEMVFDCGPDHKKNFLMKVVVNGQEFKPSVAASTKKLAKANAAAAYLQSLGLFPKDGYYPI